MADLMDHVPDLAEKRLNGREIHNAITTARQFAKWKRQQKGSRNCQLDYAMMREIVEISGRFDEYLVKELYEGLTHEDLARQDQLR